MMGKKDSIQAARPVEADLEADEYVKKVEVSKDEDIGAAYANALDGPGAYTEAEEKSLRWKLDRRIIVIMWLLNTLKAIDKVTTSTGVLYGMKASTGLDGDKYSWVGSSFYFGYLVWCFPSATLLQKLPIAKFISIGVGIWGVVLIATGFSNNFPTLVALRVLLGALEAPVMPGTFLMMNMWFTRREQTLRTGFMITGLSVLFTGPVGWGIGFMKGPDVWRSFFWITGGITVLFAIVVGTLIPDNPITAKFITERQKAIAVDRIRADQGGIENKTFKREQMIECFTDMKTWLSVLFQFFISIPNGGLTNFSPLIIHGLGYSSQNSTLIMMPTGIIQTAASWSMSALVFWAATKYPKKNVRCIVMMGGQLVGMISAIFLYTLPLDALKSRLAALYMSYFYIGAYALSLGLNATNTVGHTKKVTFGALIFITYCASNIVAPQFFKKEQAPLYPLGIAAILGSYILSIMTIGIYMAYCYYENRRRDRVDDAVGERVHLDTDFKDLTDKQNIHFRYAW